MKRISILFFISVIISPIFGQVSISNQVFFSPNDIIETNQDMDGVPVVITPASSSKQTWDFSGLSNDGTTSDTVLSTVGDPYAAQFPGTTMIIPFAGLGKGYAKKTSTEVAIVGVAIDLQNIPIPLPLPTTTPIVGSKIIQYAPMQLGSNKSSTASLRFAFPSNIIPGLDSLIQGALPIPGAQVDSIRLTITDQTDFTPDAWGTVKMPTGTFDALRVKMIDNVSTKIEVYAGLSFFKTWIDVSSFLSGSLPIPTNQKNTSYTFYNPFAKDPLITAQLDSAGNLTNATWRKNATVPAAISNISEMNISVYPTFIKNTLSVENKTGESIDISIVDLTGKKVYTTTSKELNTTCNVGSLSAGNYIVLLKNNSTNQQGTIQIQKD